MRVTESQLLDIATTGVGRGMSRTAVAAGVVSSGDKVTLASDDPVAWAQGMRAEVRKTHSALRGSAIATSRQRLTDTDTGLSTISQIVSRALSLGVQAGTDTASASDRRAAASELRGLQKSLIAAANTRDASGQYVLAGSLGGSPAFDDTGAFVGDAVDRTITSGEGLDQAASVSGSLLTVAGGVDVYATLDQLATAMEQNNGAGVRGLLDSVRGAVTQVANARTTTGLRMKALDDADSARLDLEKNLDVMRANAMEADPAQAASDFTRSQQALQAAQLIAQQIVSLTQPR